MSEFLDEVLTTLARRVRDVFFVQIGALDGVHFDPIFKHVKEHHWRGVLVEPVLVYFEQLKKNYGNCEGLIFENTAITEKSEERPIVTIDPGAVENSEVPIWAKGASSFLPERTALSGLLADKNEPALVSKHVRLEMVHCLTLPDLFVKHKVTQLNLLQIDAEGYDYKILKQLDFSRYRPECINIELLCLPADERQAAFDLLDQNGYSCYFYDQAELLGVRKDI